MKTHSAVGRLVTMVVVPMLLGSPPTWAAAPCGEWRHVSIASPGTVSNTLSGVAARSALEAWAVGSSSGSATLFQWDGTSWTLGALPSTSHLGTAPVLNDAFAAPGGDVWAVGFIGTFPPAYGIPLVIGRRGGSWNYTASITLRPQTVWPYAARGGSIEAVDGSAADDVWGVGNANGFGDGVTSIGLAVHWDGSQWTEVDVPRVANKTHLLYGVKALATNDAWAVGYTRDISGPYFAVTYHWNGSLWAPVPNPARSIPQTFLYDVAGTSPNDVWAVGERPDGALFMHWDGSSWTLFPGPTATTTRIYHVEALAPDDVWAVAAFVPGFYHWDGVSWSLVSNPVIPGAADVGRVGGMAVVDQCNIWNVGYWSDGTQSFNLTEELVAPTAVGVGSDSRPLPGAPDLALRPSPNPAPGNLDFLFVLEKTDVVTLEIYDTRGSRVAIAAHGEFNAGPHRVAWNGLDRSGQLAPSGVYFARLATSDHKQAVTKITFSR